MLIRRETEHDYNEIYNLVKEAFAGAEHSDGNEQDLVNALRNSENFVPQLALVAEVDGKIAGYIMFTKALIGTDTILALAPLAVLPAYQKQGVGGALIKEAHAIAQKLGFSHSLVLGSEKYYPRFGYIPAEKFGIIVPQGIPSENFMALKLNKNARAIGGAVTYAKEFGME